ncbi:uncharacterized protein LOC110453005 isoform X2 [Mizuhopecten yessoensis]|uniref:PH domain-containing protein n=1 Tax=Mizuhopecten yessoensis TaxID=6573 RepID=A0A210QI69_MIZYE|nr:uncharacterized protein LOC110453005 isoform X2 [Mizuhopecten yessoensis]OWF48475.1 hypothetical protein KP79_PYT05883 [Mizuhopecten yessoensis]
MGSTDSGICFEGLLVKVAKSRNTQSLWCTLDGESLAFYRNKRASCMFTIEISRVKSVTPFLDKNQFEIVTEKSFLFSAETAEICQDWINHIEEARQQDGQLVLTSQKQEEQPVSPRRGSLPQHHAVTNALKRLSSKSEKGEEESSTTKPQDTKTDRKSITKDMINKFSTGVQPKETECPPSRPSRPNSGGKVNSLLLRFSSEGSNPSSTSPVSPSPHSPVGPFSPKSLERPTSSNISEQPSSSSLTARPLSVGHQPISQKMQGITTTSSGTKIDLSEVSRAANEVVPSRSETIVSGDRHTDSGYTSGICSSPPKETQDEFDLHTVNGQDICEGKPISQREETEDSVVLRPKGLTNGDVDDSEVRVTMRRPKTQEDEGEEVVEEEEEEEENEHDGPNLQLLDDLMSLTFEETEVPQSSPVDLSVITELKGILTDLPTSLLLRRSVDVNNRTPIEELSQFLETAP